MALFESGKRNERLPLQMAAGKKPAHCEINSIKSLKLLFDENEEKKETTQQVTNQPTNQRTNHHNPLREKYKRQSNLQNGFQPLSES